MRLEEALATGPEKTKEKAEAEDTERKEERGGASGRGMFCAFGIVECRGSLLLMNSGRELIETEHVECPFGACLVVVPLGGNPRTL